ncbi:cupin-like domain-containing protein [Alteromonadaceae bacterium BrNp21-10]|nr:cupin-like domain-containing protein [Alteromonadaceae bacterium BrNp21-10]
MQSAPKTQELPHVREIHNATPATLTSELLSSDAPVVLRGLLSDWPLVKAGLKSAAEADHYLRQFYNHNKIHAMVAPAEVKGRYFYNDALDGFNFTRNTTSLTEVLDDIHASNNATAPSSYYVGSTSIDHILPEFRQHNDIPPLADKPLISIWLGNQSRIAAHYDVTDNVACCAVGQRRFTLFPPAQLDNLYIGPLDFTPAGQPASLVDFHQPDFTRFPKFETALQHAQIAELNPGDALFIPSMWWHHVEALSDFNVLVNYWWRQVGDHMGVPADALLHALLSIKDLPASQRDAWRNLFEHYVFSNNQHEHIPTARKGALNAIDDTLARQLRATLINKLNR